MSIEVQLFSVENVSIYHDFTVFVNGTPHQNLAWGLGDRAAAGAGPPRFCLRKTTPP